MRELPIPAAAQTDAEATELVRAWAADRGLHVSFRLLWDKPDNFGILLADVARHAARAYSAEGKCPEEEALERIFSMFMSEWAEPTDRGRTKLAEKQAH